MSASKIEWTGRSDWNPVRGCTRASEGCRHCYAEQIAGRFSDPGQAFHGFANRTTAGGRWTGKVEVQWDRLTLPLSWRKPATIFANSTSDIFHEHLSVDDIAAIYAVAVAAHHLRGHTTQILTKRPDRARELLTNDDFWDQVNALAGMHVMERVDPLDRRSDDARATLDDYGPASPPPGVWLGTSIEDRAALLRRAGDLRQNPAVVRFFSCEPLIGPLGDVLLDGIHWVIAGGENGPRPMHPDWVRSLRDQCAAAGVPFFFKQWGSCLPGDMDGEDDRGNPAYNIDEEHSEVDYDTLGRGAVVYAHDASFIRFKHKRTGRMLDGLHHDGMPA